MTNVIDFTGALRKKLAKAEQDIEIAQKVRKAHDMLGVAHLTGASAQDIFDAAGLSQEEYLEYIGREENRHE